MRNRSRVVLWSAGFLAVAAGATVAVILVVRPGRDTDRLVGSWQGEGTGRTIMSMNFGEAPGPGPRGKSDLPVTLQTSIRATFNRDGTMTMSFRSEGDGIKLSFEAPDPKNPGDVARWAVVQTDGDATVVRLIDPEHPEAIEWRIVFHGADEFSATPTDPSKGTDAIMFRRVGR
jgi:hypothetical protein